MSKVSVNQYRVALGMKPLLADGEWKEWLHPRDKFGRWIEKLSHVKIDDRLSGIIEGMNDDGTLRVRITHDLDNARIGERVNVRPRDIEAVPAKAFLHGLPQERIDPGKMPWTPFRPLITGDRSGFDGVTTWAGLKDALRDRDLVIFDTETTGLNVGEGGTDGPTQIGAVRIRNGKVVDRFQTYVHQDHVPPEVVAINNISAETLKDAPDEAAAMKAFHDWIGFTDKTVLVAHNANFDMQVVHSAGFPKDVPVLDSLTLARAVMPKSNMPVENHQLGTLAAYFGVELKNAHRADADAEATGQVIAHLLNYGEQMHSPTDALRNLEKINEQYNRDLVKYQKELLDWRSRLPKDDIHE